MKTVQHLLDREWIIAIAEELDSNPAGIPFSVEPAVMGQFCAEMGMECDPLAHGYRKLDDVESFIVAYKDTTELWAQMITDVNNALPVNTVDIEGQLEELNDGMEDCEWWARGQW